MSAERSLVGSRKCAIAGEQGCWPPLERRRRNERQQNIQYVAFRPAVVSLLHYNTPHSLDSASFDFVYRYILSGIPVIMRITIYTICKARQMIAKLACQMRYSLDLLFSIATLFQHPSILSRDKPQRSAMDPSFSCSSYSQLHQPQHG